MSKPLAHPRLSLRLSPLLGDTLQNLASHRAARYSYIPVLGMELREAAASLKALQLVSEFKGSFKDIRYTLHPDGLSGELAGKGSNLAWATRSVWMAMQPTSDGYAGETHSIVDERSRTVITVMDSDSELRSSRRLFRQERSFILRSCSQSQLRCR